MLKIWIKSVVYFLRSKECKRKPHWTPSVEKILCTSHNALLPMGYLYFVHKKSIIITGIYKHKWCNLGESVGSRTRDIFSFLFDCNAHLEKYILLKSSLESVQWSQGYEQMKILRTIEICFFLWLYLTINAADFWLIPLDRNTYVKYRAPWQKIDQSWPNKTNTI